MKVELTEEKRKVLREALYRLNTAYTFVDTQASGTQPFPASKFLNVLAKELGQLRMELMIFLGDFDLEKLFPEVSKMPSLQLLKVLNKELEEGGC